MNSTQKEYVMNSTANLDVDLVPDEPSTFVLDFTTVDWWTYSIVLFVIFVIMAIAKKGMGRWTPVILMLVWVLVYAILAALIT